MNDGSDTDGDGGSEGGVEEEEEGEDKAMRRSNRDR